MENILVTGANGFLAYRFCAYYRNRGRKVVGKTHREMDFTDGAAVRSVLLAERPDVVLHAGAISDIAACKRDPELSQRVNVEGVRQIALACHDMGARLVLCSSDQVYMGNGVQTPHREEGEALCPPTLYGTQKLEAERLAMGIHPDTVCLRLPWMFAADAREGEHGNLVLNARRLVERGETVRYPVHDYRSITDVWEVVRNLETACSFPPGIYNFGSENDLSTYQVAEILFETMGWEKRLLERNEEGFSDCPRNLKMDTGKAARMGVHFRTTEEAIRDLGRRRLPHGHMGQ